MTDFAGDFDGPAVRLCNRQGARQPQPDAVASVGTLGRADKEALEKAPAIGGGYAGPVIGDGPANAIIRHASDADSDVAAVGRELLRVGDQIQKCTVEARAVADDKQWARRGIEFEALATLLGERLNGGNR